MVPLCISGVATDVADVADGFKDNRLNCTKVMSISQSSSWVLERRWE